MVWDLGKVRRFAYCCGEHQAGYGCAKLFWFIFSRTVSVLVEDSDGRWSGEIIVDSSDRCCVCREPNSRMAKLVLYGARVLCFSFTFPMTRLSLRAFDPILVALVRGAGAGWPRSFI